MLLVRPSKMKQVSDLAHPVPIGEFHNGTSTQFCHRNYRVPVGFTHKPSFDAKEYTKRAP